MPALFIGHGNPMNALGQNQYTEAWHRLGESIPRPKAILAISAHWYIRETAVTAIEKPRTIHDFGGFPRALFEMHYPAPGNPQLAEQVRDLLAPVEVTMDRSWGLDHGTWSVLVHIFPKADIPVVQLSIDATQPARFHYELAKQLRTLRDAEVLIMGSGNVVHNLPMMKWTDGAVPFDWATRFNETVRHHLLARNHDALINFDAFGEDARLSIPTPEHYLPLLYVIAQQENNDTIDFPVDGIDHGSISMMSIAIGNER